ncbi:UDP-N-acetylmuramoyl-L-alanyl-D-glutamate--2,6-diaminopimelate ligase [Candidatus Acetothermia bacterium]|nr:UDP-N-acetylmuramoyl-L-alanyl-D-glutamate--2,6-diaminopimelate ligase [Candidatus Acetothermia bacterium]MBI3642494.1 UDP-N-acetylmuramoyl-L-alanyl-D-glutamate--2,6-diaminopimelate ligase [Candidatus Acetothermia bacterium]
MSQLISGLAHGSRTSLTSDPEIFGISLDSRSTKPGDLFVAIRGHKSDGHAYIPTAIEKGVVAIVVEDPSVEAMENIPVIQVEDVRKAFADLACALYDNPTRELFTVGVTGTKGKSSVCHYSAAALGMRETKLINTITNALEREVEQTTPEAATIQRLAFDAVQAGKKNLVLEVSAHALAQERARGVDFDVAVFTNLSHDHFDYFSSRDAYLDAKLKLFKELKSSGLALIRYDDPVSAEVQKSTRAQVLRYGLDSNADIRAEIKEMNAEGTSIKIHTPSGTFSARLHLPGQFYVENALAAVGVGLRAGIDQKELKARLESVTHIEGRFERYATEQGFAVVIDFAHSPDSLEKVIKTLKLFYPRVITVFGCGGDSDRAKRPQMGKISGQLSAYTIITNDNPKYEEPSEILSEIESGMDGIDAQYEVIEDRWLAIDRALALAKPGDVVLIAGKGHERKQVFSNREIEFNDREYLIDRGHLKA